MSDRSNEPLSAEEARELDTFGELRGAMLLGLAPIDARARELWEREILFGREDRPSPDGILPHTSKISG